MQQNLFKMIITGFLFTGILAFGVRNVDAAPIQWTVSSGGNGHFYDVVATPLSWSDAKVGAEALTLFGVSGHLATMTSAAENDFVFNNVLGPSSLSGAWLGGFQPPGTGEPLPGWTWITGEPDPVSPNFTNWNNIFPHFEPNDIGGEDHMAMQSSPCNPLSSGPHPTPDACRGTWFDLNEVSARPYLVEWEGPGGAPIPEPSTMLLLGTGLVGLIGYRMKKTPT